MVSIAEAQRSAGGRVSTAPGRNALKSPPAELRQLIARIESAYRPLQIWLFGSRARNEAHPQSDWDLMVIVPDSAPAQLFDAQFGWEVQRNSGVHADIVCARESEFLSDLRVANTGAREVDRDGILLYAV